MPRLRDRLVLPPGGLRFYQAETNWAPTPHASFEDTVNQIIDHRNKNRWLVDRHGWKTDRDSVALELDEFNTKVCLEMRWNNYIALDNPPESPASNRPGGFTQAQIGGKLSTVKRLAAGAALLMEWEESGEPPVAPELSSKRAAICAGCPKNSREELTAWFTLPVSTAIKGRLQRLHSMNLSTPSDDQISVCSACLCPLRLKVHCPIHLIKKRTKPEVLAELAPQCWMLQELAAA